MPVDQGARGGLSGKRVRERRSRRSLSAVSGTSSVKGIATMRFTTSRIDEIFRHGNRALAPLLAGTPSVACSLVLDRSTKDSPRPVLGSYSKLDAVVGRKGGQNGSNGLFGTDSPLISKSVCLAATEKQIALVAEIAWH